MSALKGGTTNDFSGSLAEAMEQAMDKEWQAVKGTALPSAGADDRKLLWAAIANGILNYLKAHEDEIVKTVTLDSSAADTVTALELNIPEA
ncbi:MAG: hypothetical protein JW929_09760 [Anaerolineales bacterium]|nr:hypothetical protein [Anaerolineales bacterium]